MRRALLAAALLGLAAPANATLQIAADVNGGSFLCIDNNVACDTNLTTGTIQLNNQTINGVTLNGSIQTSQGTPANPASLDILNTSSLSFINNNPGTITARVTVGDTNFTAPVSIATLSASGTWQTAVGSSAALTWYADTANAQGADFATDTPGTLLDSFTSNVTLPADSLAHNNTVPFAAGAPFSMTESAFLTLTPGGQLLSRGQTILAAVTTPEPASMLVLGGGLVGLGLMRRRHP